MASRVSPEGGVLGPEAVQGYLALNAYFDRVVVLTLRRATERHAALSRALAGLDYELFYGQDKRELDPDALVASGVYDPRRARRLHRHGREMTLGQVACTLSHRAIWQSILDRGDRRVLIFEDDAVPDPAALSLAGAILAQLPESWELLYLGYDRNERATVKRRVDQAFYVALAALRLGRRTLREALNLLSRPYSPNLRRAGFHDFTHAYAVTARAAARLAAFQAPVVLNADSGLTRAILRGELEAYVTEPKLFHQSTLPSQIAEE